jgi:hypothetical protein
MLVCHIYATVHTIPRSKYGGTGWHFVGAVFTVTARIPIPTLCSRAQIQATGGLLTYECRSTAENSLATPATQKADASEICDDVSGIAVPVNSESQKLTSYENEACNLTTVRGVALRAPTSRTAEGFAQDIREYLGRPVVIDSGAFSQTSRGLIKVYSLDLNFLNANIPQFQQRVVGALGVRATLVLRLQVNANPFQAGRLRLCFYPETPDRADYVVRTSPGSILSNPISQLPGVELDICESTSCMLRIPYIRHNEYIPLNDAGGAYPVGNASDHSWGSAFLYAYLPLTVVSGSPNPTYTMWLHLEDIDLVGSQGYPLVFTVPQSDILSREEERPISKALHTGGRALTLLGRGIPSISSFTGTASWALRAAGNLACSFGWSKPVVLDPPNRMMMTTQTYQHNCDGHDVTYNLGMFSDNHIVPLPGFAGSDVDEMAFAYILGQWAQVGYYTLSTTDSQGQLKWAAPLTPRAMWFNNGAYLYPVPLTGSTATEPAGVLTTPVFFLANTFLLWRGSFEFKIKIAKTKFHTGRLLLAFCPITGQHNVSSTSGVLAPNILTSPMHFPSVIWDLREGNEMIFRCPFVSELSYLKVGLTLNDVQDYGNFYIFVLDPLQAPSTAATVVPFTVEVRCSPDFEFHQPMTPLLPNSPFGQTTFLAQSDLISTTNVSDAQHCTGEHVRSVKQMISRACGLSGSSLDGATFSHWWSALFGAVPTVSGGITNYPLCPFVSYFSHLYGYARGSTVYDAFFGGTVSGAGHTPMPATPVYAVATMTPSYNDPGNRSCNAIIPEGNQLHIRLPYTQPTSRVLMYANTYDSYEINQMTLFGGITGYAYPGVLLARAGDDSQMGFFLGSPPLDLVGYIGPLRTSENTFITGVKALIPTQQ